jgi:hypothetical protein
MAIVTATFYDQKSAERAVSDLTEAGIDPRQISVVMSEETRQRFFPEQADLRGANIAAGAVGGSLVGGALGAIAGGVLLSGTIILTGGAAAPLIIAGPLFGALAGGATGAAIGSVIGALVAAGLSEDEAQAIENDVKSGGVVLAVPVPDPQAETVRTILQRDGGGVTPGTPRTVETVRGETTTPTTPGPRTTTVGERRTT